ncbi:hypothetical protein HYX70_01780 [Candidatus Saccharibacteria bacterium]|nr:hypothetical protein [Candidatus Saccharibacteria bacterium]
MAETVHNIEPANGAPEGAHQLKNELQKSAEERAVLTKLESLYPPDQQTTLIKQGEGSDAAEVILCGSEQAPPQLLEAVQNATSRLEAVFGTSLDKAMPGLKVYVADGVIEGGGLALGKQNAVIVDRQKGLLSVQDAETTTVELGFLNPGDWTRLSGESGASLVAETNLVHEVGHILDERVHGHSSTPTFEGEAPTRYGDSAPQEDYAESFLYYAYGKKLAGNRSKVIADDINKNYGVE